jgi:hypothetical protein
MPLPQPRGRLSELLSETLSASNPLAMQLLPNAARRASEQILDEDAQLSLLMLYELHYRGLEGVSDDFEWNLDLLGVRAGLEKSFERALRELAGSVPIPPDGDLADKLFTMTAPQSGPSLSRFMAARATVDQFREFLTHRSVYHLKEADPHSWAIPRLSGRVKAALIEVQADEYGGGRADRMHASLFARSMRALDLDDRYGALVDLVPAPTLVVTNTMSLFGLSRRLLGAIAGHLAAFEMTSSLPNRMYGNGLRRLGFDREATLFFDEHVEADAVHEQIAGRDLAGGLAAQQPEQEANILFGAAACLAVDDLAADHLLRQWNAGTSSLRRAG